MKPRPLVAGESLLFGGTYPNRDHPSQLQGAAWCPEEFQRRLAAPDASPKSGILWEQVRNRLRGLE